MSVKRKKSAGGELPKKVGSGPYHSKHPAAESIRKVKKIVVMRHAHYDHSSHRLSSEGEQQISNTAEELKGVIAGKDTIILTSSAFWVPQGAELLGEKLGITKITKDERLTSNSDDIWNLMKELPTMEASVIILVTHEPEAKYLLGELGMPPVILKNGEFRTVNLE